MRPCWRRCAAVQVKTCGHTICMDCARDLLKRHNLTPALCPYCRGVIAGFGARLR